MSVRNTVKSIQDIMRQDTGVDGDAQRISQLCWMFFLKIIDDQDQEFELLNAEYRSPLPKKYKWRTWAADPEGITGEELMTFVNGELFPALKSLAISTKPGDRRRVVKDVFEDAYNYMKSGQLMRQVVNKINEVDFNDLVERQHFGDIYEQVLNDLQSAGNAGEYYTPRAVTAFMVDRIDPHPGEILLDPACGTGGFLTCALRHMRERYVKKPEHEQKMQAALRAVEKKQLPHMLCVTNMLLHGIEDPSFVRHDNTLARPYISYTQSDRVDIVLTNPPFGGREEDGIESNFPKHFQTRETADLFLALIVRLLKKDGRAAVVLPDGTLFGEGVKTRLKEHLMEECNLHTIVRLPNSVFRPYASIGTNLLFFEKGAPTKEIWFYEHRVPEGQKAYSMTKPIRFEHLQGCIDWWGGPKRKGREETPQAWSRARKIVRQGDVLYSCVRPYLLNIAVVEAEISPSPIASTAFAVLNGFGLVLPRYQWIVLRSPYLVTCVEEKMRGQAYPAINDSDFALLPFPLPPLAEQHRIVAKVDELMALCDRLEAARAARETVRDRLAAASLARLNEPDPETFQNDARFALDALPALTTRPDQIKQLRQSILNLAVLGKLVLQDPADEPTAELLKRIAKAKAERKKTTGDARIKIEPDPKPDELAVTLPRGWAVQSFENLFLFIDYRGNTPPKTDRGIPLITAKNIRMGSLNREPREYISKATFKTWMTRGFPEIGDLFFTTEAPLANICINDIEEPFALAQRAICFQPYAKIDTKFLMYALMSDVMQSLIDRHATGMTAKGIKAANLKPLPIPIPPLAEQHRIVAKVDALMALCDRLEAGLATAAETRRRLLDALLAEALAPGEVLVPQKPERVPAHG